MYRYWFIALVCYRTIGQAICKTRKLIIKGIPTPRYAKDLERRESRWLKTREDLKIGNIL